MGKEAVFIIQIISSLTKMITTLDSPLRSIIPGSEPTNRVNF